MDFPQPPQGAATPFPAAPQPTPTTPPSFPATPPTSPLPAPSFPPQPVQIPVQGVSDEQVYAMPEKFLSTNPAGSSPSSEKPPRKKLTIVLIVLIILMVLATIGGVAYYFLVLAKAPVTTTTSTTSSKTTSTSTTNTSNNNVNAVNASNANSNTNKINSNVSNVNNANTNSNTNSNTNAVVNTNTNVNTNVNAPVNTNTNISVPAKDTDGDGLTNDEEKIWGTKADLPDTDGDGYKDGVEVVAGYDPTNATSAGKISDNAALVDTYTNSMYSYTVLHPNKWIADALTEGDNTEILFTPNTLELAGQFVAISVTSNPSGLTALDWYVETNKVAETSVKPVTTFSGLKGVWSADGSTAYFVDNDYVYAVSYRYGTSAELFFPDTFQLMVKSFSLN
ncbi:MAG: hypothetical protein WCV88_02550 [Patescibacteria group bacterium]|jgi:flagellar basal body-associated protein FliL